MTESGKRDGKFFLMAKDYFLPMLLRHRENQLLKEICIKRTSILDFSWNALLLMPSGFAGPVITNGKFYIGADTELDVYGLF